MTPLTGNGPCSFVMQLPEAAIKEFEELLAGKGKAVDSANTLAQAEDLLQLMHLSKGSKGFLL